MSDLTITGHDPGIAAYSLFLTVRDNATLIKRSWKGADRVAVHDLRGIVSSRAARCCLR